MKKDNKKERALDKERTITIIISVVVALVLWSYVMIQINPTKTETIYKVPVKLLNEQTLTEKQLAILGDDEYTVDIIVEGKRSVIDSLKSEDVSAEIQLFGWGKGENYITVDARVLSDVKIVQVKPDRVKVTIEDLVAVSKPVIVTILGEFPQGMEEGEILARPSEIEVKGAKTAVESVREIKVYVEAGDITTGGSQFTREVVPLSGDDIAVDHVKLSTNHVNVSGKLLYKKEVELLTSFTGTTPDNQNFDIEAPDKITIKGEKADIDQIEFINTEAIDLNRLPIGGNIELRPILPEKIELVKNSPRLFAKISFVETLAIDYQLQSHDLNFTGVKQGLIARPNWDARELKLIGEKQLMENLQTDQLKFVAELDGYGLGDHQVPIKVSLGGVTQKIEIEPKEVTIRIEEILQENLSE